MARRGQAALEYLFTYGWAFLAVLVTIGVLAYFGVFNVSALQSNDCSFIPGIVCSDYTITPTGGNLLRLDLRNTFGVPLTVTDAYANSTPANMGCTPDGATFPTTWDVQGPLNISCAFPSGTYHSGTRYDFVVTVKATQQGQTYLHNLTGTVSASAQ